MHKLVLRCAFFAVPVTALAFSAAAGCSDQTGGDEPMPPDAATDAAITPPADVFVPIEAAAVDSGLRDCVADKQADGVQEHLDCTGLYSDFATKTVGADNQPYTPAVQFWSDGADKSRFLYLPAGTKIDITNFDEWVFPDGTKIWKEFRLGGKRIETRLYFKASGAWKHTTYRWNDAETEAVREDSGEKVAFTGLAPYEVPDKSQCDQCHAGRKEPVLGIEAVQLGLPGASGITLATLAAGGRFNLAPPVTSITLPDDGTTKSAAALGWLHGNCGQCHNNGDNAAANYTNLFFLLRPSQLLPDAGTATVQDLDTWKTAVNVMSDRQNVDAGVNYILIKPSDPANSLASILSGRRVAITDDPDPAYQMPPLVTRRVDTVGHALLDDWITALPP
jgi:hypothetical protein